MTSKVLEAMMLVMLWDDRDTFCYEAMKDGCKGCPFDQSRVCDKVTTEFVLKNMAKRAREYFEEHKR
jgi:hypothetical protein